MSDLSKKATWQATEGYGYLYALWSIMGLKELEKIAHHNCVLLSGCLRGLCEERTVKFFISSKRLVV